MYLACWVQSNQLVYSFRAPQQPVCYSRLATCLWVGHTACRLYQAGLLVLDAARCRLNILMGRPAGLGRVTRYRTLDHPLPLRRVTHQWSCGRTRGLTLSGPSLIQWWLAPGIRNHRQRFISLTNWSSGLLHQGSYLSSGALTKWFLQLVHTSPAHHVRASETIVGRALGDCSFPHTGLIGARP